MKKQSKVGARGPPPVPMTFKAPSSTQVPSSNEEDSPTDLRRDKKGALGSTRNRLSILVRDFVSNFYFQALRHSGSRSTHDNSKSEIVPRVGRRLAFWKNVFLNMFGVRKRLEKAWFSLLLFGFICIGVFRVLEDPKRRLEREAVVRRKTDQFVESNHVTKPLDPLRRGFSDHVLFFNRVPKSGSEMLVLLLQWLQGMNGFRHVRLKGGEKRRLSVLEQEELVEVITVTEKAEAVPISFDRHVYFVNFTKFDKQWPIYVNLVRDPVDKAVSRFYYGRVTPNPNNPDVRLAIAKGFVKDRKPEVSIGSFEDCVVSADPECNFVSGNKYDLTIPYFCGQDSRCQVLNDDWALQRAKENVDGYFPVVGVLEELNSTLAVLERKIPIFFKGVQNVYFNELLQPHKNKNRWKPSPIQPYLRSLLKNQLKHEYDFYYWLKSRLLQQYKEVLRQPDRPERRHHT